MARSFKRDSLGRWHDRATGRIVKQETVTRSRAAVRAWREREVREAVPAYKLPPELRSLLTMPPVLTLPPQLGPFAGLPVFVPLPLIPVPLPIEVPFRREEFAWKAKSARPEMWEEFSRGQTVSLEILGRDPVSGTIIDRIPITFNAGDTQDEFWSNYYVAMREAFGELYGDKGDSPAYNFTVRV